MAPTEAKDTFFAKAAPIGTMTPTEAKDIFNGHGPIQGPWASTDTKDAAAFTGNVVAPPALDTYATGGNGGASSPYTSGTVTLSTTVAHDVIVLEIVSGGFFNASYVTSITDTAGLTWKRRHKRQEVGLNPYVEVWWAHAPGILTGDVITVNVDAEGLNREKVSAAVGTGAFTIIAMAFSGCNTSTPWDRNTLAPWFYDTNNGNPTTNISTNASDAVMLALYASDSDATAGTISAPFTYITGATQMEHEGNTMYGAAAYAVVSSPQIGVQATFGQSGGGAERAVMTDALVGVGQPGTSEEVYWFLDNGTLSNNLVLSSTNQSMPLSDLQTFNEDLMYVVLVMIQSGTGLGEVSSITDSLNMIESPGFQRRKRVTDAIGTLALETWFGYGSLPFSFNTLTINTTETSPNDVISAIVFAVGGTTESIIADGVFWDGDPSLPADNAQAAGGSPGDYPHVNFESTINPHCLLVAFQGNFSLDESGNITLPFVQNAPPVLHSSSAAPPANLTIEFMYTDEIVDNQLAEFNGSPSPTTWIAIGDAIPVGPPTPPTGTWGSTEAKDKLTHTGDYSSIGIVGTGGWVGYVPAHAVVAATDRKDIPGGAPAQAPYNSIGWIGWVPAHATVAATDQKDRMTNTGGWVLGPTTISGRMAPREARDRMAFSNIGPAVTGSWSSHEAKDRYASFGFPIPKTVPSAPKKRRILLVT